MSFEQPLALYGLLFILIPIIIHLFRLSRYQKFIFSSNVFLNQILSQSNKSKSPKKWLLLCLRCLLIALISLGFARPNFSTDNSEEIAIQHALLLDNSISMLAEQNGIPIFEQLKTSAIQYIKQAPANSTFGIYTADGKLEGKELVPANLAIELIQGLSISNQSFSVEPGIQAYPSERIQKLIISDFNQNTIPQSEINISKPILALPLSPSSTNNVRVSSISSHYLEFQDAYEIYFSIKNLSAAEQVIEYQLKDSNIIHYSNRSSIGSSLLIDTVLIKASDISSNILHIDIAESTNSFDNSADVILRKNDDRSIIIVSDYTTPHWTAFDSIDNLNITILSQEEFQSFENQQANLIILDCKKPKQSTLIKWNSFIQSDIPNLIIGNSNGFQIGSIRINPEQTNKAPVLPPKGNSIFRKLFLEIPNNINTPVLNSINRISANNLQPIIQTEGNGILFSSLINSNTFLLHHAIQSSERLTSHAWFPLIIATCLDQNYSLSNTIPIQLSEQLNPESILICKNQECFVPQIKQMMDQISIYPESIPLFGLCDIRNRETNQIVSHIYIPLPEEESNLALVDFEQWKSLFNGNIVFQQASTTNSVFQQETQSSFEYLFILAALLLIGISFVERRLK